MGKRCEQTQDNNKHWETDFVTSSQNGEPQALYRPDGTLRWQAPKSTLWGQRPGSTEDPADPGLAFAGQYRDTESGLCYNRFRYYDSAGGCYVSPDPIGIAGGDNNYAYAPNPISWIDPLGLAGCNKVYRQITADDLARLEQRLPLQPKGVGGSILEHVAGRDTRHISAAMTKEATKRFNSGNGLIEIDVKKAIQGGAKFIDHNNVLQAVERGGNLVDRRNAKRALEVLFKGEIPFDAIKIIG
nr:RHS repeat-associated core domain-containing protein [Pectobacterium carotovorum]